MFFRSIAQCEKIYYGINWVNDLIPLKIMINNLINKNTHNHTVCRFWLLLAQKAVLAHKELCDGNTEKRDWFRGSENPPEVSHRMVPLTENIIHNDTWYCLKMTWIVLCMMHLFSLVTWTYFSQAETNHLQNANDYAKNNALVQFGYMRFMLMLHHTKPS